MNMLERHSRACKLADALLEADAVVAHRSRLIDFLEAELSAPRRPHDDLAECIVVRLRASWRCFSTAGVLLRIVKGELREVAVDRRPPLDAIISTVAALAGVQVDQIIGRSRDSEVCLARGVVMVLGRDAGWQAAEIARKLDDRDHTTIIKIIQRIRVVMARDSLAARLGEASLGRLATAALHTTSPETVQLPSEAVV